MAVAHIIQFHKDRFISFRDFINKASKNVILKNTRLNFLKWQIVKSYWLSNDSLKMLSFYWQSISFGPEMKSCVVQRKYNFEDKRKKWYDIT